MSSKPGPSHQLRRFTIDLLDIPGTFNGLYELDLEAYGHRIESGCVTFQLADNATRTYAAGTWRSVVGHPVTGDTP